MNAYIGLPPAYATPHLCGPGEANICTGAALFSARGGGDAWLRLTGCVREAHGGGNFFCLRLLRRAPRLFLCVYVHKLAADNSRSKLIRLSPRFDVS